MAKLKKAKVTIHICPTCKGNGYLIVATEGKDTVHQCWDCDSEGEFYETTDMGWMMMVLLTACTKDLKFDGFDPTTSIVKWVFTGDKKNCLLYTSPSPRDGLLSRMPSSA